MSEFTIYCTECHERLSVDDASRAKPVICPYCETKVIVPDIRRATASSGVTRVAQLTRRGPANLGLMFAWVFVAVLGATLYASRSLALLVGGFAIAGCIFSLLAIRQGRIWGGLLAAFVCINGAIVGLCLQPTWRQPQRISADDVVLKKSRATSVPELVPGKKLAMDGCILTFEKVERHNDGLVLYLNVHNTYGRMSVYVQNCWQRSRLVNDDGDILEPVDYASSGYANQAVHAGESQTFKVTFLEIGPGPYTLLSDPGLYRSGDNGEEVCELSGRQTRLIFDEKDMI